MTGTVRLHRALKAPPERVYGAWQESRAQLAMLVEPEIPQQQVRPCPTRRSSGTPQKRGVH